MLFRSVVGGGFVGLSCALHLQRLGRRVLLLDRAAVPHAGSASHGNAGTMAVYANVPVNSPDVLRNLPRLLTDLDGPLSIKPTAHLPSMLPWAALFAWHCRPSAVAHTAQALGALLARAAPLLGSACGRPPASYEHQVHRQSGPVGCIGRSFNLNLSLHASSASRRWQEPWPWPEASSDEVLETPRQEEQPEGLDGL